MNIKLILQNPFTFIHPADLLTVYGRRTAYLVFKNTEKRSRRIVAEYFVYIFYRYVIIGIRKHGSGICDSVHVDVTPERLVGITVYNPRYICPVGSEH